mgnify:FL=1
MSSGAAYTVMFLILILAIFGVASSSIGIQYFNKSEKIRSEKPMRKNRIFLIVSIPLYVIFAVAGIFLATKLIPARTFLNNNTNTSA